MVRPRQVELMSEFDGKSIVEKAIIRSESVTPKKTVRHNVSGVVC